MGLLPTRKSNIFTTMPYFSTTHAITASPSEIERECSKFLSENPQFDPHPIERGTIANYQGVSGRKAIRRVFGLKVGKTEGVK